MAMSETVKDRAQRIVYLGEKLRNDLASLDPAKPPFEDIYELRALLEALEQDLRGESSTLGDAI